MTLNSVIARFTRLASGLNSGVRPSLSTYTSRRSVCDVEEAAQGSTVSVWEPPGRGGLGLVEPPPLAGKVYKEDKFMAPQSSCA